jgi:adenylate cyclase
MAELQARFDNLETAAQSLWRYPIPEGKEISIGRRPQTDLDVPDWNRADWVVEDPRISGKHVGIVWDGKTLRVRRRLEPADRPAVNPVFYKGKTTDDCQLLPGESFTIGSTTFTLQLRAEPAASSPANPEPEPMTQTTIGRKELRATSFADSRTPLIALADLPEIIRTTRDDTQLEERLLDIILKALPPAEFAAFVQIDPKGGPEAKAAVTRSRQRPTVDENFRVSNRLTRHAILEVMESVLVIWDKKSEGSSKFTVTMAPGADWAICAPLEEKPARNRALYVAGRMSKGILNDEQVRRDPEFLDYQKFINLAADLFSTMRDMFRMERQNIELMEYVPRRMWTLLEQQKLRDALLPKDAEVTGLFCDLRGSSSFAQTNLTMMDKWNQVRSALNIMTKSIFNKEGIIGGLFGDAAVGFWGWPTSSPEQIDRAVLAALTIRNEFQNDRELQRISFNCGIGLAHGPAIVGGLSPKYFFKLDAYGPTMNLASRLESLTKVYGVEILCDQAIVDRLRQVDPEQQRARVRPMGKVLPVGIKDSVNIYELMPPLEQCPAYESAVNYNLWDVAIRFFVDGKWDKAQHRFNQFLTNLPDERLQHEKAAHFFIEYITKHLKPPDDWDGTVEMTSK